MEFGALVRAEGAEGIRGNLAPWSGRRALRGARRLVRAEGRSGG